MYFHVVKLMTNVSDVRTASIIKEVMEAVRTSETSIKNNINNWQ
jgi:hypothetical protein